jgi:hypothetical protein
MPLIVCHSPKGGTGTSFIAAQLAMALAEAGEAVTLLDCGTIATTALHLGLAPAFALPGAGEPMFVEGLDCLHEPALAIEGDVATAIASLALVPSSERMLIVDLPSGDRARAAALAPLAQLNLCAINAAPDCASLLPGLLAADDAAGVTRLFVINAFEPLRPLARHCEAMLRAMLGERLVGSIRRDAAVDEAQAMLMPLRWFAPASAALADAVTLGTVLRAQMQALPRWAA